jgi:hypothetical protein
MLAGCTSKTTTTSNTTAPASSPAATSGPNMQPATSSSAANTSAAPAAPGTASSAQPTGANVKAVDACALLTSDDIKAVQGEEVKETKPSQRSDASFAIAQCFYTTPTFTKSVSLELTQPAPGSRTNPREFWHDNFTRAAADSDRDRDKDRAKDKDKNAKAGAGRGEEEEGGAPPQRIKGLGDEAYWINSRVSGALYVLKGDRFIRISLGGTDTDAARQQKAKALAQKALSRL